MHYANYRQTVRDDRVVSRAKRGDTRKTFPAIRTFLNAADREAVFKKWAPVAESAEIYLLFFYPEKALKIQDTRFLRPVSCES